MGTIQHGNPFQQGMGAAPTARQRRVVASSTMPRLSSSAWCSSRLSTDSLMALRLQQRLERLDVIGLEPPLRRELRHQRRQPATEQAIDQRQAGVGHPGVLRDGRGVEEAPAVTLGGHGALLEQAVEQCLDRGERPALLRAEDGGDLIGGLRCALPERAHDLGLGVADGWGTGCAFHDYDCKRRPMITHVNESVKARKNRRVREAFSRLRSLSRSCHVSRLAFAVCIRRGREPDRRRTGEAHSPRPSG
mmetsp:Transcript_48803/g.114588  ORF Transcript_48803/g.114588 Transcript_48803/m.114588 type:complete len:248 (-) Transcript_48803:913-1656(-)